MDRSCWLSLSMSDKCLGGNQDVLEAGLVARKRRGSYDSVDVLGPSWNLSWCNKDRRSSMVMVVWKDAEKRGHGGQVKFELRVGPGRETGSGETDLIAETEGGMMDGMRGDERMTGEIDREIDAMIPAGLGDHHQTWVVEGVEVEVEIEINKLLFSSLILLVLIHITLTFGYTLVHWVRHRR